MIKWQCKSFEELSKSELYEIMHCRQQVFVDEQQIAYVDCDYLDNNAYHIFATDEQGILAYARILPPFAKGKPYISFGRVLTCARARGQGLGKKLVEEILARIPTLFPDEKSIVISAQYYLEKFYQTFGFTSISSPYIEEGIDHIEMQAII